MADMSNEQAARVLTKEADGWGDERVSFGTYKTALRMGAAALRGPQPDPKTGLVPCGCGGNGLIEGAYLDEEVPSSYRVCLSCAECGMSTAEYEYEQEARMAWNTAMGWRVEG